MYLFIYHPLCPTNLTTPYKQCLQTKLRSLTPKAITSPPSLLQHLQSQHSSHSTHNTPDPSPPPPTTAHSASQIICSHVSCCKSCAAGILGGGPKLVVLNGPFTLQFGRCTMAGRRTRKWFSLSRGPTFLFLSGVWTRLLRRRISVIFM